jgi:hypothetical protein
LDVDEGVMMSNFNNPIELSAERLGQLMMERYAEQVRLERERQKAGPLTPTQSAPPTLPKSVEDLKNPYRGVDMPVAKK